MQFGIMFDTHIDKWDLIRYADELGYDTAWVPDSSLSTWEQRLTRPTWPAANYLPR